MTVSLLRVDDRLIHGQVVVGWGQALNPERYVLADDEIAADEWEAELYRAGVPDDIHVEFLTIRETAEKFDTLVQSDERTIVLVKNVDSLQQLCSSTPGIKAVNLGGLHQEGSRTQRLPYVFLNETELSMLKALQDRGVSITAQDLPNAPRFALEELQ